MINCLWEANFIVCEGQMVNCMRVSNGELSVGRQILQ